MILEEILILLQVTRVWAGFDSVETYYRSQSGKNYVDSIRVPFLSLNAQDDPVIPFTAIPAGSASVNPYLFFASTRHGGHLGWFQNLSFYHKKRWSVKVIIEWLLAVHEADPKPRSYSNVQVPKLPKVGDEMVKDPTNPLCGFQEVGDEIVHGGQDFSEASALTQAFHAQNE